MSTQRQQTTKRPRRRKAADADAAGALALQAPIGLLRLQGLHLVALNPAAAALLGMVEGQALGDGWTAALHADEIDAVLADLHDAQLAGATFRREFRLTPRDGQQRVALFQAVPDPTDGPAPTYTGYIADITARRGNEYRRAQTRTADALSRLAADIAHDFNNLLMVISANVEMAQKLSPADAALRRHLTAIVSATDRGTNMVRQLIAGERLPPTGPVDLNDLMVGLGPALPELIGDDVEVLYRRGRSVVTVGADRAQLEAALLQLIRHAGKVLDGHGRLTLAVEPRWLAETDADGLWVIPGPYAMLSLSFSAQAGRRISVDDHGLAAVASFAQRSGGAMVREEVAGGTARLSLLLPRIDLDGVRPAGSPPM